MKFLFCLLFGISFNLHAKVTQTDFSKVISIINKNFYHYSHANGRKLKFFTNYSSDWAQAFARRWDDDEIHVYGGFAKINNASTDSLALIICHELGHLHAGAPYSNEALKLSVEGLSDYWATNVCMKQIIDQLPLVGVNKKELEDIKDLYIARILQASIVVTEHFALNAKEKLPNMNTSDSTVVEKTLKTHPSSQCRLDTLMNGLFDGFKPLCWFGE